MTDPKRLTLYAITGLLLAWPAAASDPTSVAGLGAAVRAQAGAELQACAQDQGIALDGDTTFLTQEESTMVFAPVAGIEVLSRDRLVDWTVVGMFTAQGPADAEAPSGTFRVEVRADLGTTNGEFRIVDEAGNVVQEGDTVIDTDPTGTEPLAVNEPAGVNFPLEVKDLPNNGKGYYYGNFWCPWYYPYFFPYYFHYWPGYKYGCYRWYYRWWWGNLHFRYCWYPSRYCVHCRGHW